MNIPNVISYLYLLCVEQDAVYTVNHKKGGSTFVIITLGNLHRFL